MSGLSVIIPNYNNADYIEQCVGSIIDQTLEPDEIIIVDDASADDSVTVINALSRRYSFIKGIFLEKNGGVSNARNTGIEASSGEYVTVIDADDFYYNRDKLKNEMSLVKRFEQKGRDILAYSVTMTVDQNGSLTGDKANRRWHRWEFINGYTLVPLVAFTKQSRAPRDYCIKKELLLRAGAYSFYKNFYEDLDLLMRIANAGTRFYCTFSPGTAYRQKEGGLSARSESEHLETRKEIRDRYYEMLTPLEKAECSARSFCRESLIKLKRSLL